MTRLGVHLRLIAALLLAGLGASGCLPSSQSASDEVKEPHFVAGKTRETGLDYKGATEAFEKALEVNPGNASAHFELALLCEKDETDVAGAIYHFDRYLRLRPNGEYVDRAKERLLRCKQQLAANVSPVSPTPNMQRDLERLTAENRDLKRQLEAWQTYYASHPQASPNPAGGPGAAQPVASSGVTPGQASQATQPAPSVQSPATAAASKPTPTMKVYKVQAGDTPIAIARKYGVKLEALLAANPDLDPKRMKVNQPVNIPTP